LQPVLVREQLPRGDADPHLLGRRVRLLDVVQVAGGDRLDPHLAGQLQAAGVDDLLLLEGVGLHLQVEVVAEDLLELAGPLARLVPAVLLERDRHRALEAAGEDDQPLAVLGERLEVDPGPVVEALQVGEGRDAGEVLPARVVLGEHREVVVAALALLHGAQRLVDLTAEDRLDPALLGLLVEVDRPRDRAVIGERDRGLTALLGPLDQARDLRQPVQQAVVRVHVEVDEVALGVLGHAAAPSSRAKGGW